MPATDAKPADAPRPTRPRFLRPRPLRAAAALLLAFGAGGLALHLAEGPRRVAVVALTPGPVAAVKDGAAALRGQVAEVYGDKFVLADETGRALVETGPAGRGATLVKTGETVTAQGRFDHGALHALVLTHADGRQDALDPGPGPGPGHGPGAPPPPPPGPRAAL